MRNSDLAGGGQEYGNGRIVSGRIFRGKSQRGLLLQHKRHARRQPARQHGVEPGGAYRVGEVGDYFKIPAVFGQPREGEIHGVGIQQAEIFFAREI